MDCFCFVKMAFWSKNVYFSGQVKSLRISTTIKMTILVYESECLIRSPDWNDHFKTTIMIVHRLPEKSLNFRKFENCRIWLILMSRASTVLKFFLCQDCSCSSKCCKRMELSWPLAIEFMDCGTKHVLHGPWLLPDKAKFTVCSIIKLATIAVGETSSYWLAPKRS